MSFEQRFIGKISSGRIYSPVLKDKAEIAGIKRFWRLFSLFVFHFSLSKVPLSIKHKILIFNELFH